jgi:CubicO group peptidase (beta-lactamase class C family)
MIKYIIQIAFIFFVLAVFSQSTNSQEIEKKEDTQKNVKNTYSKTNSLDSLVIDSRAFQEIDSIVKNALINKVFPGCQILITKKGKTIYEKSFGQLDDKSNQKVTPNTIYDLASLSKTTGTLLAIMKLYDTGKLKLNDKASQYVSFLKNTDKENITLKELLFHTSGLPASLSSFWLALEKKKVIPIANDAAHAVELNSKTWQFKDNMAYTNRTDVFTIEVSDNFYLNAKFHDEAMRKLAKTKVGAKIYVYSCVNFIVLKEVVEAIANMPMNEFLDNEFYEPMGLKYTSYRPLKKHKKEEIAPTLKKDFLRSGAIQGYVHDPDAAFLGGVSGNAGLFSNARDIALIHQMLLNKGTLNGKQYLSEKTSQLFTTTVSPTGRRGLGFNKPVPSEPKINPCCPSAPMSTYGHTGYTGTACWVDPENEIIFVFLSNRTYPNDGENKLAKMNIRPQIQEVIYKSMKLSSKIININQ